MDDEKLKTAEGASQPEAAGEEIAPETPSATEDEWRAALETAVKQRDDYLQTAQRVQAEFANFKRRNAQSRTDGYDEGVRDTLLSMLPVVDNLERAIEAAEQHGDTQALYEGVKMTLKQLLDAAGRLGMEEIPALGERFDPEMHNAVLRAEEGEPGTVLEVFQKGYRVKDKIIRYAMVKVAAE